IPTDGWREIAAMLALPRLLCSPPAVERPRRAADLRRIAEAVEHNVAAGSGERARNAEADAAGRPGDDRNFSLGHRRDVVVLSRHYGGPPGRRFDLDQECSDGRRLCAAQVAAEHRSSRALNKS